MWHQSSVIPADDGGRDFDHKGVRKIGHIETIAVRADEGCQHRSDVGGLFTPLSLINVEIGEFGFHPGTFQNVPDSGNLLCVLHAAVAGDRLAMGVAQVTQQIHPCLEGIRDHETIGLPSTDALPSVDVNHPIHRKMGSTFSKVDDADFTQSSVHGSFLLCFFDEHRNNLVLQKKFLQVIRCRAGNKTGIPSHIAVLHLDFHTG